MKAIKLAAVALVLGASSMSAQATQQGKADSGKKAPAAKMAKTDAKADKALVPTKAAAPAKTEAKAAAPKADAKADKAAAPKAEGAAPKKGKAHKDTTAAKKP